MCFHFDCCNRTSPDAFRVTFAPSRVSLQDLSYGGRGLVVFEMADKYGLEERSPSEWAWY